MWEIMVQSIILEKFEEWTKNSSPIKSRIKIFENIRDIPYATIPELIDPVKGPIRILTQNRGSCSPKHFLLGIMYQKLNIPIQYASYPFNWNDLEANIPPKIRKLAEKMPIGYHVACKAYINKKWIIIDATWDLPLKREGFPVNEDWDGISNTKNAVKPHKEIVHDNEYERMDYFRMKTAWHGKREETLNTEFYNEFNNWLEKIRSREY